MKRIHMGTLGAALAMTIALTACGGNRGAATPAAGTTPSTVAGTAMTTATTGTMASPSAAAMTTPSMMSGTAMPATPMANSMKPATRTPGPTRTPATRPSNVATSAARPTLPAQAPTLPDATVTTGDNLPAVQVEELVTYVHPSNIFAIDVPGNWLVQDNSADQTLRVSFVDEQGLAGVIVAAFDATGETTPEVLTSAVEADADGAFGSMTGYVRGDPEVQSDGSIRVNFAFQGADNATYFGAAFIQRDGNIISLLYTIMPYAQYETLVGPMSQILNSYAINPDMTAPSMEATPEMSESSEPMEGTPEMSETMEATEGTMEGTPEMSETSEGTEEGTPEMSETPEETETP